MHFSPGDSSRSLFIPDTPGLNTLFFNSATAFDTHISMLHKQSAEWPLLCLSSSSGPRATVG
jgi:hypothetical protein